MNMPTEFRFVVDGAVVRIIRIESEFVAVAMMNVVMERLTRGGGWFVDFNPPIETIENVVALDGPYRPITSVVQQRIITIKGYP
jgi:hypothetical protein